jgi:hypothetical protein
VSVLASSSTASQVYPGLVGFLVVAGMGLALYFLFRSLNKQLRKIAPGQPTSAPPGTGRPPRPGLATYRAAQADRARAAGDPGAGDQSDNSNP